MTKKPKQEPSIETIVEKMGGPKAIARLLPISASMVRKWPRMGIHWSHWHVLIDKGGYTARELHIANMQAAGKHYGIGKRFWEQPVVELNERTT